MDWKQAVLTIFLGNVIVLIPMTLNAHPGTAYGIPFPVLICASFGTLGSNIPALMRGLVACGWFGIQTWIGGAAIYAMVAIIFGFDPGAEDGAARDRHLERRVSVFPCLLGDQHFCYRLGNELDQMARGLRRALPHSHWTRVTGLGGGRGQRLGTDPGRAVEISSR